MTHHTTLATSHQRLAATREQVSAQQITSNSEQQSQRINASTRQCVSTPPMQDIMTVNQNINNTSETHNNKRIYLLEGCLLHEQTKPNRQGWQLPQAETSCTFLQSAGLRQYTEKQWDKTVLRIQDQHEQTMSSCQTESSQGRSHLSRLGVRLQKCFDSLSKYRLRRPSQNRSGLQTANERSDIYCTTQTLSIVRASFFTNFTEFRCSTPMSAHKRHRESRITLVSCETFWI